MIGIGGGELILILLVAFIVVGPKDLPKVARALGKTVKRCRRAWREITDDIDIDSGKM